jgi:hypothetical protein
MSDASSVVRMADGALCGVATAILTADSCLLTSTRLGAAEGDNRVLRGGSWNNDNTDNFRCAYRNNNRPDNRNNNNGFRCASTLDAGARTSTEAGACQRESRRLPGCPETDGRIHKRDRGAGSRTANATRFWKESEVRS